MNTTSLILTVLYWWCPAEWNINTSPQNVYQFANFFFFENRKTMIDLRRIISTKGWIHASLELNTWTSTNITIKILFFLSSNFRWKKNVKYTLSICFQSIKALFFCRFTSFSLILTLSYGLSIKKILSDSLFILHFIHSSFFLKQFKIFSLNFVN